MGFEWFGHHKILRVVKLTAKVINEEPLRVGAGPGKSVFEPIDLVVLKVRDPSGRLRPVIPGSSWKGIFRATAFSIATGEGLKVCSGVPNQTCLRGDEFYSLEKIRESRDFREKLQSILRGEPSVCPLCLIFGTPSLASHLNFYDSMPSGEYSLGYRTGVAINRKTGAAARGALFTVEYVEPGCTFDFTVVAENLPNYALGLLVEVMDLINAGIVRVGGLKSRGFGRVRFENCRLEVYSLKHEKYGVSEGVLKPLDPLDTPVTWHGSSGSSIAVSEGEAALKVMEELRKAWRGSLNKLREVQVKGGGRWRWEVAVSGVQESEHH